jgi:hypothetical protein
MSLMFARPVMSATVRVQVKRPAMEDNVLSKDDEFPEVIVVVGSTVAVAGNAEIWVQFWSRKISISLCMICPASVMLRAVSTARNPSCSTVTAVAIAIASTNEAIPTSRIVKPARDWRRDTGIRIKSAARRRWL